MSISVVAWASVSSYELFLTARCSSRCGSVSEAGLFGIVRVADRVAKPLVELRAVQHHLLRMHRLNRGHRDREVTGILDIDNNLGPSIRRDDAHSAELLASVGSKRLESNFDFFLHGSSPADQ